MSNRRASECEKRRRDEGDGPNLLHGFAFFAATGMILSAAYMLWLYRRVVFGPLVKEELKRIGDMRPNEIAAFAPLVVLAILMGVYPSLFTGPMLASIDRVLAESGATDVAPAAAAAARLAFP